MEENRRIVFYLENVGNASALSRSLAKVGGVVSVKVDEQNKILEYVIDEWASDYDIFTEVMRICAECGASIDFDRKEEVENDEEKSEEIVEEGELPPEIEEDESIVVKEEKKEKRIMSERAQRVLEIGIAIVALVVAFFTKDLAQYIFLAVAFAVAGYDALYEAFVKMTKKQIVSEELLISLAFFASIVLGYPLYAVIALILYSIVAFARKIIKEEIDKNPAFSKKPVKLTVYSDEGISNVEAESVEVGTVILVGENCVCPCDGILDEPCDIEDFKGVTRSAAKGEEIYAGEKVLTDAKIIVTAKGEDCKFGKFNAFVNNAYSSAPIASKMQKNAQLINICVLALCLLISFIPPIFSEVYKNGLIKWAYAAVIIATVSGLSYYIFASEINLFSAISRGRRCKLGFGGYNSILKIAKGKKVFIDHENALCDKNGELKADALGALRELKAEKVKDISLVCSLSDEKAEEVCKFLKIKEYYSRETQELKNEQMKKACDEGGISVTSAENYGEIASKNGAVVCFDCEAQGYFGDGSVSSDEIAYLPYALKLAKRTEKIQKANLIFGLSVKAVLVVLAILGIADLWWAVLADSVVSVLCALLAFFNGKEIY